MTPSETAENGNVNRVYIRTLTEQLRELDSELKRTREALSETREQLASIKTEVRLTGAIIMLAMGAIIALVINHIAV